MARVIAEQGRCALKLAVARSVFASLMHAIVFQQLHGRAAGAITAGCSRCRTPLRAIPIRVICSALARRSFARPGCSLAKITSLRGLAQATIEGVVPTIEETADLDDEAIIARVTRVRGVGTWTAQMLLIFTLGRPDVLPTLDFGVRTGFRLAHRRAGLPTPRELEDSGQAWAPHRTIASWYLWRVAEDAANSVVRS